MSKQPVVVKNRYELQKRLGKGSFGTAFLAIDRNTQRPCVLKQFSIQRVDDWKTLELFEREAKILKHLKHPNIPAFLDAFVIDGKRHRNYFLVQEYVQGKSLAQWIAEGRHFTAEEAHKIALKLFNVLNYLHRFSPPLIHRDIKPQNILLTEDNQVYLIDFGSVRNRLKPGDGSTVVGTFGYMPPEQTRGRTVPASDIYSVGMTLIHILSHIPPSDMEEQRLQIKFQEHVNVSKAFRRILEKMVEPQLKKRYENASDVRKDLRAIGSSSQATMRFQEIKKWSFAAGGIVLVIVGIVIGFSWLSSDKPPSPVEQPVQTPLMIPTLTQSFPSPPPTPVHEQEMDETVNQRPSPATPADSPIIPLNFTVLDAGYSAKLDRIIMLSENPHQLHIYDPSTQQDDTISLSRFPNNVSVGPSGEFVAVGHDAHISYIDLRNRQVIATLDVTADVHSVVLADNGWVYASPKRDQWEHLRAVEIATNTEVQSTGNSIRAGSVYKLHPSGQSLYGADRGLSPSDIEKIDISGGAPVYAYDSPYHGDYSMCGDLWMSEDGQRIFTACGNVFRASSNREKDMTYNGKLSRLPRIQHVVHSSAAQRILALPKTDRWPSEGGVAENSLVIFEYETLNTEAVVTLPDFIVNNTPYISRGRFVFINSIGSEYYVIVEADEESGLLHGFGIIKQSFH